MKAQIATVKLGHFEFEGLMLEDASYGISALQLNELISFGASKNTVSRDLKRLLGNSFSPSKIKIEGLNQLINCVPLSDVERLLFDLSLTGNQQAIAISRSLIGASLTQIFARAFGQKFEEEDFQEALKTRQESKNVRRTFTDSVQDHYLATHPGADTVPFYAFSNPSDALNRLLTGHPAKYWREKFGVSSDDLLRDRWGAPQLARIVAVETLAQAKVDNEGADPIQAVKDAVEAFHYEVWSEEKLLGKGDRRTYLRNKQREHRAAKHA